MNEILTGMKYVISGFKLIIKPGIRLYVLLPLLINTLLFAGVIIFGVEKLGTLIDWLSGQWSWLEWMSLLLWPLFIILSLTIVFFSFSIVANLISAPFNGFLADAVETHLGGKKETNSSKLTDLPAEIVLAIKSESRKFIYFICRAIPLLLLFVIPVIMIVAPFLWLIFGAWMMALEYMEFPMSNNGMLFPEVRQTLAKRKPLVFGFGLGVMFLTMIPLINFIAMPVAVAAGTKLWREYFKDA